MFIDIIDYIYDCQKLPRVILFFWVSTLHKAEYDLNASKSGESKEAAKESVTSLGGQIDASVLDWYTQYNRSVFPNFFAIFGGFSVTLRDGGTYERTDG